MLDQTALSERSWMLKEAILLQSFFFFPLCKVTLSLGTNHVLPPNSHAAEEDSLGACGWQLGMIGWILSWDKHVVPLFLLDDYFYLNGAKLQIHKFRYLCKIAGLIFI